MGGYNDSIKALKIYCCLFFLLLLFDIFRSHKVYFFEYNYSFFHIYINNKLFQKYIYINNRVQLVISPRFGLSLTKLKRKLEYEI